MLHPSFNLASKAGARVTRSAASHCRLPVQLSTRSSRPIKPCGRTSAVSVMAFKGSKSDLLVAAAREFVDCWSTGCKTEGPSKQLIKDLTEICSQDIKMQAVHPLGNIEFQGFEGLTKKLVMDANFKSSMRPNRILLSACDEEARSVFCLLECEEMGSMDEDVNLVLLELHCVGKTYGLIKLDIDVAEDGEAKIVGVTERMQLGPADACLLFMLTSEANGNNNDGGALKDATGRIALKMAATWGFPRQDIRAKPLKGEALEAAKKNIQVWCDARSSGNDAATLLGSIVHEDKFSLWDPYGVLPTVCGVRDAEGRCTYQGVEAESFANCVMPLDSVVNRLNSIKESHLIKCDLLNSAICTHHNVGFSYWRSSMKERVRTKEGQVEYARDWPIDAMAIHIFHSDGKMKDTWMLRDPYEIEKQMMESMCATPGAM